jgi:hypothetical protein
MGKNPNANREKKNHHKERAYDTNVEDMEQKALELGCEVWEVEDKLKEQQEDSSEEEGEQLDSIREDEEHAKVVDFDSKFNK